MPMPGLRIGKRLPTVAGAAGGRTRTTCAEGLGIEAQARQARYQAFARTYCPAKCWSPRNISTINVKPSAGAKTR